MLKLPEVAQRLGVSEKTARRYVKAGTIPSVFIGNAYRVREKDLNEYMRQAQVKPEGAVTPKAPELTLERVGAFLEQEVGSSYLALPSEEWSAVEAGATHEQRQAIDREWELIKQEWFASHGKTEAAPRLVPTGGNWGDVYSELFGRRLGIRLGIPSSTAQAVVREAEEDALLIRTAGA